MFHHRGKEYKYANTRRFIRLPAAWPIKCEPQTKEDGRHVTHTANVSAGGVALLSREMIPVGSRIRLEIHILPADRSILAEGKVVRCLPVRGGGFDLGIQFDQISPEDQKALNDAVEGSMPPRQRARQKEAAWWRKIF